MPGYYPQQQMQRPVPQMGPVMPPNNRGQMANNAMDRMMQGGAGAQGYGVPQQGQGVPAMGYPNNPQGQMGSPFQPQMPNQQLGLNPSFGTPPFKPQGY